MRYPEDFVGKIIQGDCRELMKQLPDKSVDLIIADPPYGMDFQSNHRMFKHDKIHGDLAFPMWIFDEFKRIARRASYVFCRWDNLKDLPQPKSFLAWVKNNWSMGDLLHEHGRQWEGILFYPYEQHEFIKRIPDVLTCDRTGNELHPTEKPVNLIQSLIMANKGEVVLDPFIGSGATAIACKNLGRHYIGFEINQKYCEITRGRLSQEVLPL